MSKVVQTILFFSSRATNLRCAEVIKHLKRLGYTVIAKKAPSHKVYLHAGTKNYTGGNFNCGHGKNSQVLSSYIKNIISELDRARDDLEDYLR